MNINSPYTSLPSELKKRVSKFLTASERVELIITGDPETRGFLRNGANLSMSKENYPQEAFGTLDTLRNKLVSRQARRQLTSEQIGVLCHNPHENVISHLIALEIPLTHNQLDILIQRSVNEFVNNNNNHLLQCILNSRDEELNQAQVNFLTTHPNQEIRNQSLIALAHRINNQ